MVLKKDKTDENKTNWRKKQNANRILANHLRDKNSLLEITDTVYAMARALEIKLEIKRLLRKEKNDRN